MVLENAENDFRALISRFDIHARYEKAAASRSKPLNVAWEIRTSLLLFTSSRACALYTYRFLCLRLICNTYMLGKNTIMLNIAPSYASMVFI